MVYKADYSIGEVHLLFNSFTFKKYCEKKGIELEDLYERIQEGTAFKSKELPELLLAAAETYALYNKQPFTAEEHTPYLWIDDLGGFNSPKIVDVFKVFASKLLNIDMKQLEVMTEEQEVKNVNWQEVVTA